MKLGCCWAITVADCLEMVNYLKNGTQIAFSAQELIDYIVHPPPGCVGNYTENALNYVLKHGITSAEEYPYFGAKKHKIMPNPQVI